MGGLRGRRGAQGRPCLQFLCAPEDKGVIPEPVPAHTVHPQWYRRLPGIDQVELSAGSNGLTGKRCMPFVDAMNTGWLLSLAATVRLEISDARRRVEGDWESDREMVSPHGAFQAAGNPYEPRPVLKFHNPWTITTPRGWSCLFLPLLNRPGGVVEVLAGVVDTDAFAAPVSLPFVALAGDGVHTIAAGTPLAQVIPFRREATAIEGVVRAHAER